MAHTSMSPSDFSLLSYFTCHRKRTVVTYDNVKTVISYFYGRPEAAPPREANLRPTIPA